MEDKTNETKYVIKITFKKYVLLFPIILIIAIIHLLTQDFGCFIGLIAFLKMMYLSRRTPKKVLIGILFASVAIFLAYTLADFIVDGIEKLELKL